MDINNDLILTWEPKIQKLLQGTFVVGVDRDDIAQELRIAIIKAAQGFDEDRGVIFHTYLHTAMVNTIRTLISRGQRQPIDLSLENTQVASSFSDSNESDISLLDTLEDPNDATIDFEFQDLLKSSSLQPVERDFIILRLEGMNMDEISKDLQTSAYKIRDNLREKIGDIIAEMEI
tara:strand:- start:1002 stop:1529 length:528 start_codon:yes stop_codon:yes gene_type:complete